MKRNVKSLIALVLLIFISTLFYYNYQTHKKENLALKLRLGLLAKNKKRPVPWKVMRKRASRESPALKKIDDSIEGRDAESLINQIDLTLNKRRYIKNIELDQALLAVDELISRNPNVYSSYKAKLILLLTKENAHKVNVEDEDIANLLELMAGFDVISDRVLRKEAFLIARTNFKIDKLSEVVEALEDELLDAENQLDKEVIEADIQAKLIEIELMENQLEEGLLDDEDYLNEDLVEIPLYRSLAKGDYNGTIEAAELLLEEFPFSILGHFFLIRALELTGRTDEALELRINSELGPDQLNSLEARLSKSRNANLKDYWKRLRF